jgi:hypothetical protein
VSDSNLWVEARNGGGIYEGRSQINLVAGFAINVHLRCMGYVTGPRISEIEYVNNVEVIDRFRIQFGQIICSLASNLSRLFVPKIICPN